MIQAIDEQKPDQVIHLGDLISDAEEISYLYPKLPVCMVPGNCDGWTTVPSIKQITLQGRSILLSHGHLWGVKSGCDAAIAGPGRPERTSSSSATPTSPYASRWRTACGCSTQAPAAPATAPFCWRRG